MVSFQQVFKLLFTSHFRLFTSYSGRAAAPHQTGRRFTSTSGLTERSLCPAGRGLLPFLSHTLLPRCVHMGTRRQEQLVSTNAVQLPAPHPRHDAGELRQLQVYLQRKGLHQGGETIPTRPARDTRYKHRKKRLSGHFGADLEKPPTCFNSNIMLCWNVTVFSKCCSCYCVLFECPHLAN